MHASAVVVLVIAGVVDRAMLSTWLGRCAERGSAGLAIRERRRRQAALAVLLFWLVKKGLA